MPPQPSFSDSMMRPMLGRAAAALVLALMASACVEAAASASQRDRDIPGSNSGAVIASAVNTSSNVDSEGAVIKTVIMTEALQDLAANNPGAKVKVLNGGTVSYSILENLHTSAAAARKNMTLYADTTFSGSRDVQGRLCVPVNPESLSGSGDLRLGVYTDHQKTRNTKNTFNTYFHNQVAIIHLDHTGAFGGRVEIAVDVDLSGLNRDRLQFYTYNPAANTFKEIALPDYYFDGKDFLHFFTPTGGDVVITDRDFDPK